MLKFLVKSFVIISVFDAILFVLLLRRANLRDRRMKSMLIVIDGTDGSGKATQTKVLVENLKSIFMDAGINKKVVHLEFPNYESSSATLVKEYLAQEHLIENPYQSSLYYSVDRIATFVKKDETGESLLSKFNDGGYVFICDRYTTSNILHQSTNFKGRKLNKFIKDIENIEYKLCGLPRPEMVIYLDVEPEVSMDNITRRYNGDESKKDSHENIEHLTSVYNNRGNIIKKLKWEKVVCSENGSMRTIESISDEILDMVLDLFI